MTEVESYHKPPRNANPEGFTAVFTGC